MIYMNNLIIMILVPMYYYTIVCKTHNNIINIIKIIYINTGTILPCAAGTILTKIVKTTIEVSIKKLIFKDMVQFFDDFIH